MHAQDLVRLNNEMREQLTPENRHDYGEMIAYIRLNLNKSEQQTEEVLMELLEHLLAAQDQGRTAKDIFGDDLRAYCDELIAEIPKEQISSNIILVFYIGLNLLGLVGMTFGILTYAGYHLFGLGTANFHFNGGTLVTALLLDFIVIAVFVYLVFRWLNGSLFKSKPTKNIVEFLQIWLLSTLFIGFCVAVFYFMPAFGPEFSISHLMIVVLSAILFAASILLNKKYRITK